MCSNTLLPGCYKEGSEAGSLVCTHHLSTSQSRPDLSRSAEIGSTENLPKLGGQEVTSSQGGLIDNPNLSHYTRKTDSRERVVGEQGGTEGEERNAKQERTSSKEEVQHRENRGLTVESKGKLKKSVPPRPLHPPKEERKLQEAGTLPTDRDYKLQQETDSPDPCRLSGSSGLPVPAPRRMLDPSTPPRPAPRTRPPKVMDSPTATGERD